MVNKIFLFVFLSLLLPGLALAEDQVISLKDGSQIKGELVGIANGAYTITTPLLGNVQVNKDQVISINAVAPKTPKLAESTTAGATMNAADFDQKAKATQAQLLGNPELMADIQNMVQDPEITQMLADPALIKAVTSKDTAAISSNPRIKQLMENPKMKALYEKLRASNPELAK